MVTIAWLLLCVASAAAREPDVHFIWQRPPASLCPTRAVLQADVEELMGRRVFSARAQARIIVRGVIEDNASGVSVHIEAANDRGEPLGTRELSAPPGQCASLRDAIDLVLTLFVEYEAPQPVEARFGLGAKVGLAQTPLPRFAVSVGPAVFVALGDTLRLHASAAYWTPVSIQTARGVGATLEAVSLELLGCARIWMGLGLCTGVESGALISTPLQLDGPAEQLRVLAHGLLEAGWELELERLLRLELAGGALYSLSRPSFSYLRADGERMAVYRPDAVGAIFRMSIIILTE